MGSSMTKLRPGWYILLYHDISWEENCYIRSIGGTCSPDLFERHVSALADHGEFVPISEGVDRLHSGDAAQPMFSFWFDDGLAGVRKYAAPILQEFNTTGALSVCSRFVNQTEFFWRFKLSYLNSIDAMRLLRARLRKHGFVIGDNVKDFTLDHFSPLILGYVDELFERFTSSQQRADAFRIFENSFGIKDLHEHGWAIGNHSAGHYPVSQEHSLHLIEKEFLECEREIMEICGAPSEYWVLPFDRNSSPKILEFTNQFRKERYIVFVGNRINLSTPMIDHRVLYRIEAPSDEPLYLLSALALAS